MKNMIKILKISGIICILIGLIIIIINYFLDGSFFGKIVISYNDNSMPSSSYKGIIEKISRTGYIEEKRYCGTADCNSPSTHKYNFRLTKNEYKKIIKLYKLNNKSISDILIYISKDNKTMCKVDNDSLCESTDDLNKDKIVTYREFANNWLDIIIKEN